MYKINNLLTQFGTTYPKIFQLCSNFHETETATDAIFCDFTNRL